MCLEDDDDDEDEDDFELEFEDNVNEELEQQFGEYKQDINEVELDFNNDIEDEDDILEDYIECNIKGKMIIPDSISLEEIEYPYSIKYNDYLEENTKASANVK